jgi:UDP-N-acetyl-2-amino-2-deoxyglucuronate dehydrogenase
VSKQTKFGFGIIGCGMIANFHARAIQDIRGASLVGCYARRDEQAKKFAAEHGCTTYSTLESMLADPAIQIVTICTPSGAHLEPALTAAKAGKHVIVEKPLEITLKRCDRMIEACAKHGVTLATIFPSRFHRSAALLKQAVKEDRFGTVTLAEAYVKWFRSQAYYDSGAWRGTWELDGGGALMNQAIHTVDLLAWLMGPVREIRAHVATLAHERIAVEDTAVATLQFENGALGVIEASTAVYPGYLKRVEIHGSAGSATMEEEDIVAWDFAKPSRSDAAIKKQMSERISTAGGASDPKAIGHHGHAALFRNVLNSLQGKEPLLCDGSEGRRSVEIILAIYKAAETGKSVALPLASDPTLQARRAKR